MEGRMRKKWSSELHVAIFPFMAKGHTIPLLYLTKLIHTHRPRATFTIFTTPANEPFISSCLASLPSDLITIISLPFPTSATNDVLFGVESVDMLPSMSFFVPFLTTMESLQPAFENALENLSNRVTCLVSDSFLHWTQQSASKYNIPRLAFSGMSNYASTILALIVQKRFLSWPESDDDEFIELPDFPWVRVTRDEFPSPFNEREPNGLLVDYIAKIVIANSMSVGFVVNGFQELEPPFLEYWNSNFGPKAWCVGPFCLVEKSKSMISESKPTWIEWLDQKWKDRKTVLYVAFGSQAEISNEQLKEITDGLERSEVEFLCALRIKPNQEEAMEGFEERVRERGLVVRGWVEQRDVLAHDSVQGFLSHCGLNSMMESICAGVPILAWPMVAEQHLNAKMVVDEIKVGLRVEICDGSVRGFVNCDGLSTTVRELMGGERGDEVRMRVKELSEIANKAMEEGGSSWCDLELLLSELEAAQMANHESNSSRDLETTPTAVTIENK